MTFSLTQLTYADWLTIGGCLSTVSLYLYSRRSSISYIPGPRSPSWLLGLFPEYLTSKAGVLELKWQKEFGSVYRFRGALGEDRLFVTDPKTIQHVFSSNAEFYRPAQARSAVILLMGFGLLWAEGEGHKRQRRIMNPAFAVGTLKALVPLFTTVGRDMISIWKKIIQDSEKRTSAVINVSPWLGRATLDVLGNAAFDYNFNSLNDMENEVARAYHGLSLLSDAQPSKPFILFSELIAYLPGAAQTALMRYLPSKGRQGVNHAFNTSTRVGRELIEAKIAALAAGEAQKDIMTHMVKANQSSEGKSKLGDVEMISQMATLILAGHDTTSNSVTWTLYALALHPQVQSKAREEIQAVRSRAAERGNPDLTYADFEAMPYLMAVMKEVLRVYPVVLELRREAVVDAVLPLSSPIRTTSGEFVSEIPVKKGQVIHVPIMAYNKSEAVWGDDAETFNPDRWLDGANERKGTTLGMFANLMTFGSGPKGCIGWRFSVIEMQALLVELLSSFEVSLPANAKPIRQEAAGFMIPLIEDEREKGAQMPLEIRLLE